ncbi:hypothetical protein N7466_009929 [Penicillium verhagenii]|uniref:uncharacterized protein n=1 Tax=Penicillium verhagenii TaxID=1562060 RepID=UPI00254509A2|nr:uncharacterized protein N7466_009929 [Penicillium verhagenii]KAJ5918986.1 hypothetical protein N7466_009929 [Penicillium verhagenii]
MFIRKVFPRVRQSLMPMVNNLRSLGTRAPFLYPPRATLGLWATLDKPAWPRALSWISGFAPDWGRSAGCPSTPSFAVRWSSGLFLRDDAYFCPDEGQVSNCPVEKVLSRRQGFVHEDGVTFHLGSLDGLIVLDELDGLQGSLGELQNEIETSGGNRHSMTPFSVIRAVLEERVLDEDSLASELLCGFECHEYLDPSWNETEDNLAAHRR